MHNAVLKSYFGSNDYVIFHNICKQDIEEKYYINYIAIFGR